MLELERCVSIASFYSLLDCTPSIMSATALLAAGLAVLGGGFLFASSSSNRRQNKMATLLDPSTSAVLITGGSRGIGRSTAEYLLARGYSVMVTVRKESQYTAMKEEADRSSQENKPYPMLLDVTDDDQIPKAMEQLSSFLKERNVKLVALVNNAGINPEADRMTEAGSKGVTVENDLVDPSIGSRVFETNVIGVGRVTRACMPHLKEAGGGGGRVVNIGSYFGSIAGKGGLGHCYYEASKFALEGMTDNMRRCLKGDGIKVSLVKPGNIATDMNSIGEVSADVVARDIEHAIASTTPRPRYYPGTVKGHSCKFVCLMFELLPTWLSDKL